MELKKISYANFDTTIGSNYLDSYAISSFISNNILRLFQNSPTNDNPNATAVIFAVDNNVIIARSLVYGTAVKCENQIIRAQSMGSIEVHSSHRGKGVGSKICDFALNNNEYELFLLSLVSPPFLSIVKKTNECTIFNFPEYVKVINAEAAFACRGIKGPLLYLLKTVGNFFIKILDIPNRFRLKKLRKRYTIQKETIVPLWAEEMCLNDGHKYAEYHDTKWLQWCLDNNLSGHNEDIQSFYAIYNKQNKPVGFFMTKERRRFDIKSCRMINGTICEWGTCNDDYLKEADINLLALSTFSKDCYRILTVTNSKDTEKKLRHMGFVKHGQMQMVFKDKFNQFPDMNDINLWRIRFGCCNSILY